MNKKIAVSGCGWLGLPLAEYLIEQNYVVNGSTTSVEKKDVLKKATINPFVLLFSQEGIHGPIGPFLNDVEVLIINIPPRLRRENSGSYIAKMQYLIKEIASQKVQKVIFISSTSVYANDNTIITEETEPLPETESGKQILKVEQLLLSNPNFKTTVVRLGGLIGRKRHPVYFLSGKENIANPEAPVNLIHLNDCIKIMHTIIEKEAWGHVFNAVYPEHPSRKEYYIRKAIEKKITLPSFKDTATSVGKTIRSEKIKSVLKYSFTTKI